MTDELARLVADYHDWLAFERGLAKNTLAAYRRDLARYTQWLRNQGISAVDQVHDPLVQRYVAELRDLVDDDGRAVFASSSVARSLVAVRSFHRFCVDEGGSMHDPSERVGAPRVPQGIPKALTEHEIVMILEGMPVGTPRADRDRAILELLYASWLRVSELIGLDLDAIDLDAGMFRVLGKGSKERFVPVGRTARAALGHYLAGSRLTLRAARPVGRPDTDAVFLNARGGRMTRQACWSIVREAGRRVGLGEQLSPHVFRHSCATHMLDHGADIRVVQEILGHASISTTQVYTKVSTARLRAAYDAAHPRARSSR